MVLTSQGLTDYLNGLCREIGQIRQRLVLYLAIFTIGTPKEMGLIYLILVLATSSGNMHGPAKAFHKLRLSHQFHPVKSLVSTLSARS